MGNFVKMHLRKHMQFYAYLACGTLTTVIDSLIYFPLLNFTDIDAPFCVLLATLIANIAGFFVMKPFVFHSNSWKQDVVAPEFWRYITTRLGSMGLETAFSLLTVSLLGLDGNVMRIIGWVLIAILNYVSTKYIVFKYRTYH